MEILMDIIDTFDYDILLQIAKNWRGGTYDQVWKVLSLLGNYGALWIALACLLLLFRQTRRAGAAMLLSLLCGFFVGNILIKPLVMRPRPFVTHTDLVPLLDPGDEWSFPSGHTLSSFAAAAALYFYHPKSGLLAYLMAIMIAFSRLYASVHYPTDVLAGVLIGIPCGLFCGWIADFFADQFYRIHVRRRMRKGK